MNIKKLPIYTTIHDAQSGGTIAGTSAAAVMCEHMITEKN
jgi:cyanophycinase-like exopeptidase